MSLATVLTRSLEFFAINSVATRFIALRLEAIAISNSKGGCFLFFGNSSH